MISKNKLKEIRSHLENSQNPLFLFDNDVDGFCAFLILRRAVGRGKGVAIKSFPELKEQYLRKVDEFNSDYVFVLDKAEISDRFIKGLRQRRISLIWIDHHSIGFPKAVAEELYIYNSFPSAEPTTYIAQKVFNRKEDLWLAMIGCIGDVYMPDFAKDFAEGFPELFNSKLSAFEALHLTEVGKMVRMLNFGLMDTITNVVKLTKYLFDAKGAYDILEESKYMGQFHKRYNQLNEFYNRQVAKAEENFDKNSSFLFFSYSGDLSMSSEIANRLYFNHPDKLIVVAYKRAEKANVSIRGKGALEKTKKLINGIEGATGGGHAEATGAMIPIDFFGEFRRRVSKLNKVL